MPEQDQVRARVDLVPVRLAAQGQASQGAQLLGLGLGGRLTRPDPRVHHAPGAAVARRAGPLDHGVLEEVAVVTLEEGEHLTKALRRGVEGAPAVPRQVLRLEDPEGVLQGRPVRAVRQLGRQPEALEHASLVVAEDEADPALAHHVHDPGGVRSAVPEVPHRQQPVPASEVHLLRERVQLLGAAVDVPDDPGRSH